MLRGRFVSKTPEEPKVVETIGEFLQRVVQFFDAGESCEPEQLLLECSNESFDTSVSILPDSRGRQELFGADEVTRVCVDCVRCNARVSALHSVHADFSSRRFRARFMRVNLSTHRADTPLLSRAVQILRGTGLRRLFLKSCVDSEACERCVVDLRGP